MNDKWMIVFILNNSDILKIPVNHNHPINRMEAKTIAIQSLPQELSSNISACQIKLS